MRKLRKEIIAVTGLVIALTACSSGSSDSGSDSETDETIAVTVSSGTDVQGDVTEVTEAPYVNVHEESDKLVADWFGSYLSDMDVSEKDDARFTDQEDYQYYARGLGKDKDYFLSPDMWEVFYNDEINLNRDITGEDIYLIRLNPNKLLELYAENNNKTVEDICRDLSTTKDVLYYNWGYNPCCVDYASKHKDKKVWLSKKEMDIFGRINFEDRVTVMETHMLVVKDESVVYHNDPYDWLQILRRDTLQAFTEDCNLYSDYTDVEKTGVYKVNGISIRTVIPLNMPNGQMEIDEEHLADEGVTAFLDYSPFSYGCTTDDLVDVMSILKEVSEDE